MDNYLSSREALEALRTLRVSGQSVTQDSIEKIIAKLSVADKNARFCQGCGDGRQ